MERWQLYQYDSKPGGIKRIKQYSKSHLSKIEIMEIYNLKIKYFNEYCIKNLKPRSGVLDVINTQKIIKSG